MSNQLSVKEILIKAKALIDTPEKWIKDVYFRKVGENNCYCALGAICEVSGLLSYHISSSPAGKHLKSVVDEHLQEGQSFAVYNDEHTHAEVMAAFDKAIETADDLVA